jgi:hypothetical protein
LWSSFSVDDIMFFLTGQREHTPDYSEYLTIYKKTNNINPQQQHQQQPQQPQPQLQPQPDPNLVPLQPQRQQPWPVYRAEIDPRNIIRTPFQRLARSASKRFAKLNPK